MCRYSSGDDVDDASNNNDNDNDVKRTVRRFLALTKTTTTAGSETGKLSSCGKL